MSVGKEGRREGGRADSERGKTGIVLNCSKVEMCEKEGREEEQSTHQPFSRRDS